MGVVRHVNSAVFEDRNAMEDTADTIYENLWELRNQLFQEVTFCFFGSINVFNMSLQDTSQNVRQCVMQSDRLKNLIRQMSMDQNISEEELWIQAYNLLVNMGHDFYIHALRTISYIGCKAIRRVFGSIQFNLSGLKHAAEFMKQNPVILIPTHRSYLDFILVTTVFAYSDITAPAIIAGDNLSKGFLGKLIKYAGAISIRRSLGSDPLYRSILQEYIHSCVLNPDIPLEVFTEGGRSRNSLHLKPKKGILSMALEPFFFGTSNNTILVPISLSYDRIVEDTMYAEEELGAQKEEESAMKLFSALFRLIKPIEMSRTVLVHIGDPILMDDYIQTEGYQLSVGPRSQHKLNGEERELVEKLCWRVSEEQHKHMVLFPFSVAALAIRHDGSSIALKDLEVHYQVLRDALCCVKARIYDEENDLEKALRAHHSIVMLTEDKMVRLRNTAEQKFRLHHLKSSTLEVAIVHILLQHERNKSLQFLVRSAILVAALQNHRQNKIIDQELTFLLNLLSEDFIFLKTTSEGIVEVVQEACLLGVAQETPKGLTFGKNVSLTSLMSYQLNHFLTAYASVAAVISTMSGSLDEKKVLELAQEELQSLLDRDDTKYQYSSLSLSTLKNGLHVLVRLGAATKEIVTEGSKDKAFVIPCCERAKALKTHIQSFILSEQTMSLHTDNASLK